MEPREFTSVLVADNTNRTLFAAIAAGPPNKGVGVPLTTWPGPSGAPGVGFWKVALGGGPVVPPANRLAISVGDSGPSIEGCANAPVVPRISAVRAIDAL